MACQVEWHSALIFGTKRIRFDIIHFKKYFYGRKEGKAVKGFAFF
jgi:hypothetical protein